MQRNEGKRENGAKRFFRWIFEKILKPIARFFVKAWEWLKEKCCKKRTTHLEEMRRAEREVDEMMAKSTAEQAVSTAAKAEQAKIAAKQAEKAAAVKAEAEKRRVDRLQMIKALQADQAKDDALIEKTTDIENSAKDRAEEASKLVEEAAKEAAKQAEIKRKEEAAKLKEAELKRKEEAEAKENKLEREKREKDTLDSLDELEELEDSLGSESLKSPRALGVFPQPQSKPQDRSPLRPAGTTFTRF